jgi:purine-nucleoside phosphorylase
LTNIFERAAEAAALIRSQISAKPKVCIVLGSGLGAFASELEQAAAIPYEDIPYFARSTVEGHAGRLVIGDLEGVTVLVQQGRFHYYEGYEMGQVVFPMRVFGMMGIQTVILTNAAGSLNMEMRPGSLMLITDHLNLFGANPLRGANDDRFGPRFPDMTGVYDKKLAEVIVSEAAAIDGGDIIHRGVYCGLPGPTYETPAEIHMLRLLGADAVGMSTVPEAIVARHQGMRVAGISCITNYGAGMVDEAIDHGDVMETGARVAGVFGTLLKRVIKRIGE